MAPPSKTRKDFITNFIVSNPYLQYVKNGKLIFNKDLIGLPKTDLVNAGLKWFGMCRPPLFKISLFILKYFCNMGTS